MVRHKSSEARDATESTLQQDTRIRREGRRVRRGGSRTHVFSAPRGTPQIWPQLEQYQKTVASLTIMAFTAFAPHRVHTGGVGWVGVQASNVVPAMHGLVP